MRKQLVHIDYSYEKGMTFSWNYVDLNRRNKYFRHIIIFLTPHIQTARKFLDEYVKYIKPGDLYAVLLAEEGEQVRLKGWREKTFEHEAPS